jgi:hypothetical protein
VAAAVAAARAGARTLLIERYGFLGGNSTAAGVNPWMTFHDFRGQQVIRGIGDEIVRRVQGLGGTPGHVPDTVGFVSRFVPLDHEVVKFVFDDILAEAGVDVLFHAFIIEVRQSGDHLDSVRVATKAGMLEFGASAFVDTTGDADIAHLSGNATWKGREADGLTQPMTMNFRVGAVDASQIAAYMRAHPAEFFDKTTFDNLEPLTGVFGFKSIWKAASLPIPRESLLFFFTPRAGEVSVNTSRVTHVDATDPFDMTYAEQEGRRQVATLMRFFRANVPGFANSYLVSTPAQIGIRESRRVIGDYVLTDQDVLEGRTQPDAIGRCGYPIDIHSPTGTGTGHGTVEQPVYDIPYRSLLARDKENLLVAGRCLSAEHAAHSSVRITPGCFATGQAAGVGAALAARLRTQPRLVSTELLQTTLLEQDVDLGWPRTQALRKSLIHTGGSS